MPDADAKTVSASQIAALYGQSPYLTEYMLYQRFAYGIDIEPEEHNRMKWGKLMQPLVIQEAASDLRLDITPTDQYVRREALGCTRDAHFEDQRGTVAVEVKCIFEWSIWYDEWGGGQQPPPHIELQLQAQMAVGDGKDAYPRGVIIAWVAGELHYFWRDLDAALASDMQERAGAFLQRVEDHDEPDAYGDPRELPIIAQRWPRIERSEQEIDDLDLAETAAMYEKASEAKSFWGKTADKMKAKLLAACQDFESTKLPEGVIVNVGKSETAAKVITKEDVGKVARKASVRTTVKVHVPEEEPIMDAGGDPPPAIMG